MNIPVPILTVIETALNAWLKLDGESLEKCEALEGKIIRLHITGLDLNLFFLPAVSAIQVIGNYPDQALNNNSNDDNNTSSNKQVNTGKVDATIHGSAMALMKLGSAENAGASLLDGDIIIDGDMRVAEKFSAILKEVDIDWEELLSKLVGDIIAHQAGQVVRTANDWLSATFEAMKLNTSEYLSEESKVTPEEAELSYYMDQVDELSMDTERLNAKVRNLQRTLDNIK